MPKRAKALIGFGLIALALLITATKFVSYRQIKAEQQRQEEHNAAMREADRAHREFVKQTEESKAQWERDIRQMKERREAANP